MKKIVVSLIHFYQRYLSKWKKPCCRFYPTCSEYAILAVEKYGVLRGGLKAIWRILRCNPLFQGGVDEP